MKRSILTSLSFAVLIVIAISSCKKNATSAGQQSLTMYLTDAPGDYEHVYVDIRSVFVKIDKDDQSENNNGDDDNGGDDNGNNSGDDSNSEWINLNAYAQVYDLLALNNGIDALLANSNLPKGELKEIKIEIGTNNSVVKNGTTYPLQLKAEDAEVEIESGNDECEDDGMNNFRLWLDFDVSSSVIELPGNIFWLKPVINQFNGKASGEVEGKITPSNSVASIKIYNNSNTYFGIPEEEGEYKIRGIKPGTYTMEIVGANGYQNQTITNIMVKAGEDTKIETIQLSK